MSWVKEKSKPQYNLDDFKDVDEDAIIEELTEEELLELNAAIDPEVSCLAFRVCGRNVACSTVVPCILCTEKST